MSISQHPTKGPGHWYIIHRPDGKKREYILFEGSEAEARAIDREIRGVPHDATYPTVLDVLPRFLAAYQNNSQPNSYLAMQTALKHLLPHFGQMRIPLIMDHHFEAYKTKRLAAKYLPGKHGQPPELDTPAEKEKRRPLSKNSINRELNCLKSVLAFAKDDGIVVANTPTLFPKKQAQSKAILPLSPQEISSLLSVLEGDHLTLAMLMFWGGLRKTEATHLRWEDVDLQNGIIMVRGKGGAIEPVPILGDLLPHLKKRHTKGAAGYICVNRHINKKSGKPYGTGKPYGNIMKVLRSSALKVGITKSVDHHLLRHTSGTAMMLANLQQKSIQHMLRHKSIQTTDKYTHMAAMFLKSEGQKLSNLISLSENSG